ncbi:ADP-ribose pyrophosphatase of COG1058 family / Nicotinamide-nucleotide amidase [hydrothermal vent metagenome]|uniref:ADP-ribose pyrophosphatase of COG1058 family / Nicotinamide-nucleotide amidase n=1 Tax=hydrothermal vent metagenome TaxID=652676 RepID=A0A3B1CJ14_9ZZZZ
MKTVIISIGNEITSGHVINSNAVWMAKALEPYGITPDRILALRDDEKTLAVEIRSALKKYELVLITGGLGPTHDDVTKPVLVKVFKTKLIRDKKTLAMVKACFDKLGVDMPAINEGQADVPKGAKILPNKWGTAPGLFFKTDVCLLFALPGVPYEMKNLMTAEVLPQIKKRAKGGAVARVLLRTIGVGESALSEKIDNLGPLGDDLEMAYLPTMGMVDIRLTAKKRATIKRAEKKIMKVIAPYYYGRDDDTPEKVIGDILAEKKLKLASAESCTGGQFSAKITSVPGASGYFLEGVVTYSNSAKTKRLGVKKMTMVRHGAVSSHVAKEMAQGICKTSGADVGISCTGVAGPTGGTEEKPVGLVYIGLCLKGRAQVKEYRFGEDGRARNQARTVRAMIKWLLKELSAI